LNTGSNQTPAQESGSGAAPLSLSQQATEKRNEKKKRKVNKIMTVKRESRDTINRELLNRKERRKKEKRKKGREEKKGRDNFSETELLNDDKTTTVQRH
jgi:hypothetical protein